MMDVSDGLSSDLSHILKASGKSAVVNLEKLPVSDTLKRVALEQKWNLDKLVSSGGEDYVLLCTIHAGHYEKINSASRATFGKELFPVGEIIDGKNQILWMKNGKQVTPDKHEWNHFTA
ncbi:MAG: hypothetical protein JW965_00290 [Bacteroidales bacterium]|nr:hypothetical protein [Bacteroidales bacterium]